METSKRMKLEQNFRERSTLCMKHPSAKVGWLVEGKKDEDASKNDKNFLIHYF